LRFVQLVQVQQGRAQYAHRIRVLRRDVYRTPRMGQRTGVVFHPPQHAGQVHMRLHEVGLLRNGFAVQPHGAVQVARVLQAKAVVQQRGAVARVVLVVQLRIHRQRLRKCCCRFNSSSARRWAGAGSVGATRQASLSQATAAQASPVPAQACASPWRASSRCGLGLQNLAVEGQCLVKAATRQQRGALLLRGHAAALTPMWGPGSRG
jgi:hypothetical protein